MVLEEELKTYKKEKESLLSKHAGKFVLIKGQKIIGLFVSKDDALKEGYKKFNNREFLVKQIMDIEPVNFITRRLRF